MTSAGKSASTAAFTIIATRIADVRAYRPAPRENYRVDRRDRRHGTCKIIPTDTYDLDARILPT